LTYSCSVDEWRANSVDCSSLLAASPIAPKQSASNCRQRSTVHPLVLYRP
jgi:hypothetical protein